MPEDEGLPIEKEVQRQETLHNRIQNERLKLSATLLNALAIASIFASFFKPLIEREFKLFLQDPVSWLWIVIGLLLHFGARYLLTYLKDEK